MQTFQAQRTESVEVTPTFRAQHTESADHPPGSHRPGAHAPGRIAMVIREGSIWVRREDGSREILTAPSVVIWEPGDWMEYGSRLGEGYKIESYWSETFSAQEQAAMMTEAFGPDFMTEAFGPGGAG